MVLPFDQGVVREGKEGKGLRLVSDLRTLVKFKRNGHSTGVFDGDIRLRHLFLFDFVTYSLDT